MKLLEQSITLPERYSIQPEDESARNDLALAAMEIKTITTAQQNESAGIVVRELRQYIKSVEAARTSITKPLLDAQRFVKALADDHCAPLLSEQQRIERIAVMFAQSESRRVAREEEERQAAYRRAAAEQFAAEEKARLAAEKAYTEKQLDKAIQLEQVSMAAQEKVAAIIAAPMPTVQKTKGQQIRKELRVEVTDIRALAAARPDLVKMEPNLVGIKATLVPESPNLPPGLRLWWEDKIIYSSSTGGRY